MISRNSKENTTLMKYPFRFTMFKENYHPEFGYLLSKEEKVVEVAAESCCEAHVLATRYNHGWTVKSSECLDKNYKPQGFVPETKYEKEAWEIHLKNLEQKKAQESQVAKSGDAEQAQQ